MVGVLHSRLRTTLKPGVRTARESHQCLCVRCVAGTAIDACRAFPIEFHELPETGMSELGAACRAAGLERLFLTALKI